MRFRPSRRDDNNNKKALQLMQRERATAVHCMYEGPLRTNVKSVKTSILVLKVIQGHCFRLRCQSKPVYDFLLVINCILSSISHRFRDMASYWFKIAKFSYPLSFRALDWGDPYGIFGKALQIMKL